jgi:thymidylate synthase ThyX
MYKTFVGPTKLMAVDDLSPEDIAMLQALYSRSAESAETHIEKVRSSGSNKFMSSYYVGYGHKSIADCGDTTMFIEGVSTLAAKAVQDWPLYSGQETSTRYIDMSKQRIEDPVGTPESKAILDAWMAFYTSNQDRVADTIRKRYPKRPEEKDDVYERAIKARTFDILRGFLPAGITTQLSWHTNLRQAGDHLVLLSKHPSTEIRNIGLGLQRLLGDAYKSSGLGMSLASVSGVGTAGGDTASTARSLWETMVANKYTYLRPSSNIVLSSTIDPTYLKPYTELFLTRPRGCILPYFLADLGQLTFAFPLDFGSFRDIQRHRNGVCRMPLLTTDVGFEPWYLDQLDPELAETARKLVQDLSLRINDLSEDPVVRQYYVGLGFRVTCQVTYGLPAAVYVMELRSGKMIHPTLRKVIHRLVKHFQEQFPTVPLHVDMDVDDWDVRRGTQTILAKRSAV